MDIFPFLSFPLITLFDKCLNSHFDDYVHSAGHYDDSREVEVEGETMVYEEVTLYYPRPNRCELTVDVIIIIHHHYLHGLHGGYPILLKTKWMESHRHNDMSAPLYLKTTTSHVC